MGIQYLLNQTLHGKWFTRDVEALAQNIILTQVLSGNISQDAYTKLLSDEKPLSVCLDNGHIIEASQGSLDSAPNGSCAIIPLKDTMLKYGNWYSYGTLEIAQAIIAAANSPRISSVIVDTDSGGGAVDAIAPIYDAITYADQIKPVLCSFDLMASAALYGCLPCREKIANNNISAEAGSIGVMATIYDMAEYLKNFGIVEHTIKSNHSKYKIRPYELAKQGKYDELKTESLDPLAIQFQDAVKRHCTSLDQSVEGILQGRMFYAKDAKAHGLCTEVKSIDYAISRAQDLSKKISKKAEQQRVVKEFLNNQ